MKMYHYPACSTCKKAARFLKDAGLESVALVHIVEQPPSRAELERLWRSSELPLKRFFNVSGQSYRNGGFKDKLPSMSESAQLDALAADGKLLKRPILVTDDGAVLVGFQADQWRAALR